MEQGSISASETRGDLIVRAAFARLDVIALAAATGILIGAGLFLATVFLLLKGAPPGVHIGTHLGLLVNYLPGYSVSWSGSLVGLTYGCVAGIVVGGSFGAVWNLTHYLYLIMLAGRGYLGRSEV